jgi:triacylglycerol lipase
MRGMLTREAYTCPMADRSTLHHVYLIPGLFGFGKLAGLDYFEHLERALSERFERAGKRLHMEVVPAPPTASIPLRASIVAQLVARTSSKDNGPIHLVGHSTGGLDARMLVAPGINVPAAPEHLRWLDRVESVLSINAPHYGTPLAGYFTTAAGLMMRLVNTTTFLDFFRPKTMRSKYSRAS